MAYKMSNTAIAWQTDIFIRIASCHETEYSTGGTIAPICCRHNIDGKIDTTNIKLIRNMDVIRSVYKRMVKTKISLN